MQYEIKGGNLPVVICSLDNESVFNESKGHVLDEPQYGDDHFRRRHRKCSVVCFQEKICSRISILPAMTAE